MDDLVLEGHLGRTVAKTVFDGDTAFGRFANAPGWYGHVEDAGLVGAAMSALADWLTIEL